MEADWDEITRIAVPSAGLHAIPPPASAIAFDDLQELLWVGNDQVSPGSSHYTQSSYPML
jgi:PAB-dependent poly(A)-specific ribonuclease subunit 2